MWLLVLQLSRIKLALFNEPQGVTQPSAIGHLLTLAQSGALVWAATAIRQWAIGRCCITLTAVSTVLSVFRR